MDGPTREPIDHRGDGHDCTAALIAMFYLSQTRRMEGKRSPSRVRLGGYRAESNNGHRAERNREGRPVSLRLDKATIAKIEADRIYDLILPETDGNETVTVPLSYL